MIFSAATSNGQRFIQQDRYKVHHTDHGTLVAVMDGHGPEGHVVAAKCADYLAPFWDIGYKGDACAALKQLVGALDSITNEFTSGSTFSAVFLPKDKETAYAAILGDSPIIVGYQGKHMYAEPHNVRTNLQERQEAIARGGSYENGYIQNINGHGLQVSRALGDSDFSSIIRKDPEVLTIAHWDWILLASDGVIDRNENEAEEIDRLAFNIDADTKLTAPGLVGIDTEDNATAVLIRRN